jgi:hypothetical protein
LVQVTREIGLIQISNFFKNQQVFPIRHRMLLPSGVVFSTLFVLRWLDLSKDNKNVFRFFFVLFQFFGKTIRRVTHRKAVEFIVRVRKLGKGEIFDQSEYSAAIGRERWSYVNFESFWLIGGGKLKKQSVTGFFSLVKHLSPEGKTAVIITSVFSSTPRQFV